MPGDSSKMKKTYQDYVNRLKHIVHFQAAAEVLQWDQETYIPAKAFAKRGEQIATLASHIHQLKTAPEHQQLLLEVLENPDLTERQKRNVELSLEDYQREFKLPSDFVYASAEKIQQCFAAWTDARKHNDFKRYEQPLTDLIELKKKEAEYLGYEDHPYSALMNDYDKGLTVKIVDPLFEQLKKDIDHIRRALPENNTDTAFLHQHYPSSQQWDLGLELLKSIGFDFDAGRQDISAHPFTTRFQSEDVRLTTRIDENDPANMIWSCIHEGGHGIYEQGLSSEEDGLPTGSFCSLSIHESQSRMWENNIGRSKAFWQYHYPIMQRYFPKQLANIDLDTFYKATHHIQSSLIRTEADEITYHYHIMIRYQLEKGLIEGTIKASEMPSVWNELYRTYLNIEVPDDVQGSLQDVHWSHGSFGYFPTYSLGSLYAAQFYHAIQEVNPQLDQEIASGNFSAIHQWLKQQIFAHGRFYTSEELCEKATGERLSIRYYTDYIKNKYLSL